MPKILADFPRPVGDNGRGLSGCAAPGWKGGKKGYDYWIRLLLDLRVKWFRVVDDGGDSVAFCEKLLAAGIFPIVRLVRRDPPPNEAPEPNPGHLGAREEGVIRRLIASGVRYFESNSEPDQAREWKHHAMPGNPLECARLVALNWLFDARIIMEFGGLPALPAVSNGGNLDLMGALATLGRQEILLEGAWIAVHNFSQNRPLNYPDDLVNRAGQQLSTEPHALGAYAEWAWWHNHLGRAQTVDEINAIRASGKNPGNSILQDHACFREFEYHNALAVKYLGRSIPIISTACGYSVGNRADPRYPRVTPEIHRDATLALFDFMQRQAPEYYFAALPWLLVESPGYEADAWHSSFWKNTLVTVTDGRAGIPTIAVPNANIGEQLPVIAAVQTMPNLARRLPGMQPAPPLPAPAIPPARVTPAQTIQSPQLPFEPAAVSRPEMLSAPVEPPPPKPTVVRYTVQPGDTLYKIAREFDVAWQLIAQANDIQTPNLLHAGQMLMIPLPRAQFPTETRYPATPISPPATPPGTEPRRAEPPPTHSRADASRAMARAIAARQDEIDWDLRLDAMNVRVESAKVMPGQIFWRLVRAEYATPEESGAKHQITYTVLDEQSKPIANHRVWQAWTEDKTDAMTNARGEASIPIWASYNPQEENGPYAAWVEGAASDRVVGMGLPLKRHVSFMLTWRKSIAQ